MADDLTAKVFAGVERMLSVSAASVLASVKEMIEGAVKEIPHGPPGPGGPTGKEGAPGSRGNDGTPGRDGRDAPPIPGGQGERGANGRDGRDGKDGADGITLEELGAALEVKMAELLSKAVVVGRELKIGDQVIAHLAFPEYKGVWTPGTYERGDNVTWGGSGWMCVAEETSSKPDGTSADWQLAVKRGRDGKDKT